ncbi:MAG: DUF2092 domain-containing protein [Methylorubrum extorquens]|jgi:hypothetical protein|uniref:DUF2092 domain-containing protein n=1 Tax=Methylorubrum extorquens TaxID=408 RepID=UPI002FEDFE58
MRRPYLFRMLLAGVTFLLPATAYPQQAAPPAVQVTPSPPEASGSLDPKMVEALNRMGGYLAGLTAFELVANTTVEFLLDNGQKIEIAGRARYLARRPDRLRVQLASDIADRDFIYDGKTLTVVAPKETYFAQIDAPPTIKAMLTLAAQNLNIELPLAELFDWGTPDAPLNRVTDSTYVGTARIRDVECQHWALRGPDHDWEIWIQTGEKPLPLKVAIVDRTDPAFLKYESVLSWSTDVNTPDEAFAYKPAEGQKRIVFTQSDASMGDQQ